MSKVAKQRAELLFSSLVRAKCNIDSELRPTNWIMPKLP